MQRWRWARLVIVVVILAAVALPTHVAAQAREHRVALVIGNAAYADAPLNNPANDARGMAQALRAQGFDVIEHVNADATTMRRSVAAFGERMREGGIGLFYYSGHGVQVNGRNYLIPIGAQIPSEAYVSAETLEVDSVLGHMDRARTRVNLVILDACRNNPFARQFRSQSRGLAFMQAPVGTFIAYATSPGDVADDGPRGGYGVFTGELLTAMKEPLKVEDVFKRVGLAVQQKSQRRQTPWVASSLTGDFSFTSSAAVASAAPPPTPQIEIKEEMRQAFGSLAVSGRIDGIEIWFGDRRIGETRSGRAIVMTNVPEGTHRLRGVKAGHTEWTRDVQVAANQRAEVVIDIEPLRPEPTPAPVTDRSTHRWRLQTAFPATSAFHDVATRFAATVDELSGGRLKIDVLPLGAVASAFNLVDSVSRGALEAGYTRADYQLGKGRWTAIFSGIAFGLSAERQAAWMNEGGGRALQSELYAQALKLNVVVLPMATTGGWTSSAATLKQADGIDGDGVWLKSPIAKPADLQGVKVRAVGLAIDLLQAAGAAVVVLSAAEVQAALNRGVIDGAAVSMPYDDMQAGLHDVRKVYQIPAPWMAPSISYELVVHRDAYDKLAPELRQIVAEAVRRTHQWAVTELRRRNGAAADDFAQKHGVRVYRTPASVVDAVRKIADQKYAQWSSEDPVFRRVYDAMRQFGNR